MMSSDRSPLIIVGTSAFSNESFSKLIGKLVEKFEITYLPDVAACISRVREANDRSKVGLTDPISQCEWYLFSDFGDSSDMHQLATLRPEARVMGYPAFVDCMLLQHKWIKPRPVFNFSMQGAVVCITGFRDRQTVNRLATMINWMGGSVRRSMNVNTTTHLVAYRCAGEKVREAAITARRIATVKTSWVETAWARRCEEPRLDATDVNYVDSHRAKVFQETCLSFVGFAPGSDELKELCTLVFEHDGLVTEDLNDERLTHVVVTDAWPGHGNILERLKELMVTESSTRTRSALQTSHLTDSPSLTNEDQYRVCMLGLSYRVPVVRLEWFWLSLQLTCLCRLEPYLYVAGPTRIANNNNNNNNTQMSRVSLHLPPLARPNIGLLDAVESLGLDHSNQATSSPMPDSDCLITNTMVMTTNHISFIGCGEPIEEVDESSPNRKVPVCHVSLADEHKSDSMLEEKENLCPREAHSLNSPGKRLASPEFDLPKRKSTTQMSMRVKSPLASSTDKVSFITSPRHTNSPRGFVSPSNESYRNTGRSSHFHRAGVSLSSSSSHDNLITQLADPMTFPSNRERRLCQIANPPISADSSQSPQVPLLAQSEADSHGLPAAELIGTCWSPASFNSGLLLNATNASDCNTSFPLGSNRGSYGFGSLVCSLREMTTTTTTITKGASGDVTIPDTVADSHILGTVKSPIAQIPGNDTQTSTPASGKHKSTSRLSLLHTTARKSRTPAPDLSSSDNLGHSSSPHIDSLRDTPIRTRLEKRQHRVFEFFVTERNYVDILRYLYRVAYSQVIDEEQPGGPILPRQEADYVFGKLSAVVELHERLQPQLNQLESNWSLTESRLGDVLHMDLLDEMDKAYGNYMQFYSPPHLHHLGEQFPRFLAFMRQVERRRESGRQSLAALLVRPVQRLPSVALLMEGIAKFTPPCHPDYAAVTEFAKGINDLLANINDRLRRNEERLSMLSLYHEIGGAPPEMLSSSRSLVARLNVFELGTSSSGSTTCEPVTLFLLTDCLEVARPRKRHTGEPMAHAMRAALAAVQGDGVDHAGQPERDQLSAGDVSGLNLQTNTTACPTAGSVVDTSTSHVTVTRTGSGASGTSVMNLGLMEGKQRCYFKHLYLLKLQEIKRVVNFDTASPDRAAFGLVVRSSSEADDRVYAYCLAASFAASAAVAAGRCPEPVESAMTAAASSRPEASSVSGGGSMVSGPQSSSGTNSGNNNTNRNAHVATLQACVNEAKRTFLSKLCHHIIQVSCLASSPDELLVDVEPEELLGFDLEQVFNATAQALKSKKFGRQLTRNISIKTSRRLIVSAKRGAGPGNTPSHGATKQWLQGPTNTGTNGCSDQRLCGSSVSLITSPRRSVLGSLLGNRGQNIDSTANFTDPIHSHELGRYASTPLRDQRSGRTTMPPPTPTADQVAMAMLKLIRPRSAEPIIRNDEDASFVHPQPLLFEDYTDDDPDADSISIASGNFGGGAWPAFAKQLAPGDLDPLRHPPQLNSTSSLHSATLDLTSRNSAMDSVTSLRSLHRAVPSARNSLSRPRAFPFGRSSVLTSSGRAPEHLDCIGQRKSVCQSVLAGLKNFRRSIAGAGNTLLHGNPTAGPFISRNGRGLVNSSNLASPALLNRSASVDAGPTAMFAAAVASPLASGLIGDHLRLSRLSLNRPLAPPLTEMTETERDFDGFGDALTTPPLPATQSFCVLRQTEIPTATSVSSSSGSGASSRVHQAFPRSMTATVGPRNSALVSGGSLRNLFHAAFRNPSSSVSNSSTQQRQLTSIPRHDTIKASSSEVPDLDQNKSPVVVDEEQHFCDKDMDDLPYDQLGSSMLSLASWDSVSTLNCPLAHGNSTKKSMNRVLNRTMFNTNRKSGTGSAVWETASHLGVTTTHEDLRRSFRLPVATRHFTGLGTDSCAHKLQKKHKKYKLGAMSHLFHRSSIAKGSDVASSSIKEDERDETDNHKDGEIREAPPCIHPPRPSTCRRESLLRGLFSR